jgi:hypothetical protein
VYDLIPEPHTRISKRSSQARLRVTFCIEDIYKTFIERTSPGFPEDLLIRICTRSYNVEDFSTKILTQGSVCKIM